MCYRMRIPKSGAYLPAIRLEYLEERIDALGSCKEREMLLAAYRRRGGGMAITDISVEMRRTRTTIHDWLARAVECGPDGLPDRKALGRRTLLDGPSGWWLPELLGRGPQRCGFQAGSWQSGTILELIRREFGISCSPRTLRRMLHRIRFSYRKPRPVPYNSAPEAGQEECVCRGGQAGRARMCRVQRGRGAPAAVRGGRLRLVSHQRERDRFDGILNSVRQDVRDPGKGRTPRTDSRSHELAHVCGLSRVGAPEIPEIRARPGRASYHKSGMVITI